jgi:competence protein ComEA
MIDWIKLLKMHWRIVGGVTAVIIILITGWALSQLKQPQPAGTDNLLAHSFNSTSMGGASRTSANADQPATSTQPSNATPSPARPTGASSPGYVDIKGAVNKPGLYQVTASMRVADVIQLAQGMQPQADAQQINLAAKVTDQQVIYVPAKGEQAPAVAPPVVQSTDKINLNTADVAALQTLSGIGQKKAEKIIDYRQQHGNFKTIDDLKNVSGFGEKTMAKYKDQLTV